MLKHLLIAFFATAVSTSALFSQTESKDSIRMVKSGLGEIRYYQGTLRLKGPEVGKILLPNADATANWKRSRTNLTLAYIFGIIGGAMVGYELGGALAGKDVNGAIIGAGAGMVGLSIVFGINSDKKSKRAINIYNAAFR
jgi:hypothetical protein